MRVAVRVDASRWIGTGHLRRTLSLAHAFVACGAEVRFVMRDLGIDSRAIVESPFPVNTLPWRNQVVPPSQVPHAGWAQVTSATDVQDTLSCLAAWRPDWMVVDSYAFDAEWHDAVRASLGCRIAAIDDLADRRLAADVVIDHNHESDHRIKYRGLLASGSKLLGSPRYALLGPTFADAPRYVPQEQVASIGIFLGGVDQDNMTAVALEAIETAGYSGAVEIVSTSANPHLATLIETAAKRPYTSVSLDLPDLSAFFARHDVQIGAGGGATWERCCIGAPTLLMVIAKNQLAVVPALQAQGLAVSPDPLGTRDPEAIAAALRSVLDDAVLRRTMSERGRALVDGQGARRVALCMLAEHMKVRPATEADARLMHSWRNDPVTRAASRTSHPIAWNEHFAWLQAALLDPAKRLMVGMVGRDPVGVIRFDRRGDHQAEVSLYLDPALHGLGLGKAMLRAGERAAASGLDIVAHVLEGNTGSARLFESAGYARADVDRWIKPATGRTRTS